MKIDHPTCTDDHALLHRHLVVPASIWTVLMVAACATAWVDPAEAPPVAPAATLAAPAPAGPG